MTKLWIGFAVVIAYGSIYPFNFQAQDLDATAIQAFLDSCCQKPSRGDILGNVVLFVPFGFLGVIAASGGASLLSRVLVVCIAGSALALALQIAQIYLPSRDESLQDVGWNFIGIFVGALLGLLPCKFILRSAVRPHRRTLIPCLLIGSWLIYRLVPFVPSIDFQAIKNSLKPLLLNPQVQSIDIFHDTVAWMIVASLLQRVRRGANLGAYLPILIVAVFSLEVLIVNNVVSASNVAGAILALVLWWGVLRHVGWQAGGLAVLPCAMLIAKGLAPFTLVPQPNSFSWLPFHGLLGGSMYVNVQAICEKVFIYGSLIYILWQTRLGQVTSTLVAIAVVAFVEFAQAYVPGHTPEITDPLLIVFAALTMKSLRSQEDSSSQSDTAHESIRQMDATSPGSKAVDPAEKLVARTINLRRDQAKFLASLSQRMGANVSEVGQEIIDQVIREEQRTASSSQPHLERTHIETPSGCAASINSGSVAMGEGWVKQTIHLRQDQVQFLEALSRAKGVSVSKVTRGIVKQFIRQL